jgi:L-lactate dehydrogenase complex protein LldG
MSPARENILARVRTAVRVAGAEPAAPTGVPIWPAVGTVPETFVREFTAIKGEIITDLPAFLSGFARIASVAPLVAGDYAVRDADLGVTGCDCLVAQTGSLFVNAREHGGRALSVLPPVHLVIATRDQIVPDLTAAFALLRQRYHGRWPSNLALITGPSRTADIEKILVMGAHGPKRLAVYFGG